MICHPSPFGRASGVISCPALPQGIPLVVMSSPLLYTSLVQHISNPSYHQDSTSTSPMKSDRITICAHVIRQYCCKLSGQTSRCCGLGQFLDVDKRYDLDFVGSTDVKNIKATTSSKMAQQYVVLIHVCACIQLPGSPGSGHSISLLGLRATPRINSFCLLFHQWGTLLLIFLLYRFGLVISVRSLQRTGHCATFILPPLSPATLWPSLQVVPLSYPRVCINLERCGSRIDSTSRNPGLASRFSVKEASELMLRNSTHISQCN